MRVLITGGHGFVGRHLAAHQVSCRDDVALGYLRVPGQTDQAPELPKEVQSVALDVTNNSQVVQLISVMKPDAIVHLAGITFVPDGEQKETSVFDVNYQGTLNLLEAIRVHSPKTRLLHVSSAEVYGEPRPGSLPLTEGAELRPVNNYALSKAEADLAAFLYSYRDNLDIVRVRPFPHIGPQQADSFAISGFCRQIAEIKLGKREPLIKVGNLEARRDFSDVSDIVRGYREALLNGKRREVYNLCSGESVQIGEILNRLIEFAEVEVEVQVDPARLRAVDVPDVFGSYKKAQKDFGWKPRIELNSTLRTMLDYWLETV